VSATPTVTPASESLAAAFAPPAGEPAWLAEARGAALGAFRAAGLPTTRLEAWRYTSLAPLAALSLARPAPGDGGLDVGALLARAGPLDGPRLVFVNGRCRADLTRLAGLPAGATLLPLSEALRRLPHLVRPHLGRLARPEASALVAASAALFEDGAFLHLPAGAAVAPPIRLLHLGGAAGKPVASFPRLLVLAGAGALCTVVEHHLGSDATTYLSAPVAELILEEGARVDHYRFQEEGDAAYHLASVHVEQAASSRFLSHALALGARLSRGEVHARLAGEDGECHLSGLYLADGQRLADNLSVVEHAAPRCSTTETFKGIIDGHGRGVFTGLIRVQPGAQKTKAYQLNSNLLLSDDATADSRPQLEILADDVKCGHGGTVGRLDEASLFYLRSRGLDEAAARSLLIYAFAAEMVERVRPEPLRERARDLVAARLPGGLRLEAAA
jgi:Fe-S cluster assembly protein SufD